MGQLRMFLTGEMLAKDCMPEIPDGFRLRVYRDGDGEKYMELMHSAGFLPWNETRLQTTLTQALPEGIFFLEQIDTGLLVATAMSNILRPEQDAAELGWVAVRPEFRGRHFAQIVNEAAIIRLRQEGNTRLGLLTDDFRLAAIKTYLKRGWQPVISEDAPLERWQKIADELKITLK